MPCIGHVFDCRWAGCVCYVRVYRKVAECGVAAAIKLWQSLWQVPSVGKVVAAVRSRDR